MPPQKGVQLRLDVVYLMQREREREFARFDRPSNYENKDEREARKKEGKNKLQGNKRGGTNVRKGGERAASSRGFRMILLLRASHPFLPLSLFTRFRE